MGGGVNGDTEVRAWYNNKTKLDNTLATYIRGYYRVLSYNEKKKKIIYVAPNSVETKLRGASKV